VTAATTMPGPRPVPPAAAPRAAAIEVEGLHKVYGPRGNHVLALRDVTLSVARGEFVCLVGASGCGKSTLLNLLAGLDAVQAGRVDVHGRVSLLFQEAALFPWLTARENVELAMRLAGVHGRERRGRAEDLLATVRLDGFGDKRPHELSGGMRQRVALARALAQGADILLMDEPFGALDAMTRDILHDELERVWGEGGLTGVFVTHDVREAVRLGDRVIVLTSRPGTVAAEFDVPLPRPRQHGDPEVARLTEDITDRLRAEVRRHAND
jgi:NitT/TauT family transport system ATP-binding protein